MPKGKSKNKAGDLVSNGGIDKNSKASRTSLAAYVRDRFPQHIAVDFHIMTLMGRLPQLVKVDDCGFPGCSCQLEVRSEHVGGAPTMAERQLAAARLTERGWGQAAQHTVIEAEVSGAIRVAGGVDPEYLQGLKEEAFRVITAAVRGKPLLPAATEVEDAELVDELDEDDAVPEGEDQEDEDDSDSK